MAQIDIVSRGPARVLRGPGDLGAIRGRPGEQALRGAISELGRGFADRRADREKEERELQAREESTILGEATGGFLDVLENVLPQTDFTDRDSVERLNDAIAEAELNIEDPDSDNEAVNDRVRARGARPLAVFRVNEATLRRNLRTSQFQRIENNDRQVIFQNVRMQNLEASIEASIGTLERLRDLGALGLQSDREFEQAVAAERRGLQAKAWEDFRTDPATRELALLYEASGTLRKFQFIDPSATSKNEAEAVKELRGRAELSERTLANELMAIPFTNARVPINTYNKKVDEDFEVGEILTKEQRDFRKSVFALRAKKQAQANRTARAKRTPEEEEAIDKLKAELNRDVNENARVLDVSAEEKLIIAKGDISREALHGFKQEILEESRLDVITRMREANELFSRNGKPPLYSEQTIQRQKDKFRDMSLELIRDKNAFNEGGAIYYAKTLNSGGTFGVEQVATFVDDAIIPGYRLAISQIGTGEITSRSVGQMMLNDREASGYPNQAIKNFHESLWEGEHAPSWRATAEFYRKARRRGLETQFSVAIETEMDLYLLLESSEPGPLLVDAPSGELRGPVSDELAGQLRLRARQIIQERKGSPLSAVDERALDTRFDADFSGWPAQARSDFKTLARKYETARSSNPEDLAANALNNVWSKNSFTGQVMRNNPEKKFGTGIMAQFEREMESLGLVSERKLTPELPGEPRPILGVIESLFSLPTSVVADKKEIRLELGQMISLKDGKTSAWPVIDGDTGLQIVLEDIGKISWIAEPGQTNVRLEAMRTRGDQELRNMKRVLATEVGRGSFESLPPELQQRYIHRGLLSERVPLFDQALQLEKQMREIDVKLGTAPDRGESLQSLMPPARRAESARYIDGAGYLKAPDFEFREVEGELRIFRGEQE